jgi:teichuronic acid exporter
MIEKVSAKAASVEEPRWFTLKIAQFRANAFARNLAAMTGSQLAVRSSRLAATVVLSRILAPEDFGLLAIIFTSYELIALFTRNGISAHVVQAKEEDVAVVAQTAHRLTWIVCAVLAVAQLVAAWPIAWFYGDMRLLLPVAAMSVIYFATPLSIIQAAFQQRDNRIEQIALAGAAQAVVDSVLAISLAFAGFGLWSIVLPKIAVAPIWVYFVRYGHAWRPRAIATPSWLHGWRDTMRFSRNVLGVELLTTMQSNFDNLLVGYFLGLHALGVYYFAFNGGLGITLGLISSAAVAVYPHLCAARKDSRALAQRYKAVRKTLAQTALPVICAQACLAPIYVPLVFGPQWTEAIPVLSLVCLSAVVRPFASLASQLLRAVGHPEVEFRWQAGTTVLLLASISVAAQHGILAVAATVFVVQTVTMGGFAYIVPHRVLKQARWAHRNRKP